MCVYMWIHWGLVSTTCSLLLALEASSECVNCCACFKRQAPVRRVLLKCFCVYSFHYRCWYQLQFSISWWLKENKNKKLLVECAGNEQHAHALGMHRETECSQNWFKKESKTVVFREESVIVDLSYVLSEWGIHLFCLWQGSWPNCCDEDRKVLGLWFVNFIVVCCQYDLSSWLGVE